MKFDPNIGYETVSQLFAEHDSKTPSQYAQEARDRTQCGVWTSFLTKDDTIPAGDLTKRQDTPEWAARNIVGVLHGTVVEGSCAEFEADPLLFPFSDEDLADAWQYLEERVGEQDEDEDEDAGRGIAELAELAASFAAAEPDEAGDYQKKFRALIRANFPELAAVYFD